MGSSRLSIFENLGGHAEKRRDELAKSWPTERCGDLNLIALVCVADAGVRPLSLVPGLPEDAFDTDGQLTKREVRAATLARLAPLPGQQLWDVGAGTGTIGIEWMRAHPSCSCVAFEEREDRATRIMANARRLGCTGSEGCNGSCARHLRGTGSSWMRSLSAEVSTPNAWFEECWDRLVSGGRFVTNAVTVESEATLAALHRVYGGELVRILVARAEPVGGVLGLAVPDADHSMGGGEAVNQHIAIGIGCSSRAVPEDIISLIERCTIEIVPESILATLDRRSSIAEVVAATLGLKLMLFPRSILAQTSGVKNHSLLAYTKTGTSSVAEAAALASLGPKAQLSLPRQTGRFCTCAVAVIR